jgi:hypothetical protein
MKSNRNRNSRTRQKPVFECQNAFRAPHQNNIRETEPALQAGFILHQIERGAKE